MIRRSFCALVVPVALSVAGCQEPTAVPPETASIQQGPSSLVSDAEPGCIFDFHAMLAPDERIGGPGRSARSGGRIHFRLVGGTEDGGAIEYRGLARHIPEIDDEVITALLVKLEDRIPAHTPEWTNPRQGDPGRTRGSHALFQGGGPVPADVAVHLALEPAHFDARVTLTANHVSVSFLGRLEPERGRSADARLDAIRECFSG
ncbi:MAG: hypothetical protein GWO17_24745 [Gemmatimonadetes bacterium]|nr:hypothetical protein [Gemmatimonadota bacterium]